MEDLDEEESGEEESKEGMDDQSVGSNEVLVQGRTGTSVIKSSRLRSKVEQNQDKINQDLERKTHQKQLYEDKQASLRIQYKKGDIQFA